MTDGGATTGSQGGEAGDEGHGVDIGNVTQSRWGRGGDEFGRPGEFRRGESECYTERDDGVFDFNDDVDDTGRTFGTYLL